MNARRERLLRWYALDERLAELADALDAGPVDAALEAEFERTRQAAAELWEAYYAALAPQAVSRCPFTGQVLRWTIDTEGLDGPWWDRDAPARPFESLLPTLHSLAGALRLAEFDDAAPFVSAPGPGAPWVSRALLRQPGVRGVLSTLAIGAHTGYLVAYYLESGCSAGESLPDWGIDHQRRRDARGDEHFRIPEAIDPEPDFDLAPWIAAGKLLWIGAGDAGLRLHATLARCPYLALAGRRDPVLLIQGRPWVAGQMLQEAMP